MRHTRALLSAIALTSLTLVGGSAFAQTPAPTAPAQPAPATTPVAPTAATPITINGVIEANYTFNLNKPSSHTNAGYLFNQKEGQFALNLAEIQIAKAVSPESRTGFTVKLIEGEVKTLLFPGASEDAGSSNILEAYGSLLIPFGKKEVKFDAGQFETHVGYEVVEIGTNNFFSHSYLFAYPEPAYDAGVRATYPVSPKLSLSGYLYNRFNGRNDGGNRDIAPGFQAAYTISPTSSFVLNGLTSRDNLGSVATPNNKEQSILNGIYSLQTNPTTKFVLEGVYRYGKDAANKSYDFYGVAGYGIFGPLGLRVEYLKDSKNTFILGADPESTGEQGSGDKKVNLGSVTLSYEPKMVLFPGVRTLIEARYDYASAKIFAKEKDGATKNQTTITLGQVYSF